MARVLFLQNIEYDYPGVMYVSALLKSKGHECDLLIEDDPQKILDYVIRNDFDIFAFSLMSGMHFWGLEISKELKKSFPDIPIIFGGVHPTYFPEVINEGPIDIVCIGEGELPMLDVMNALDRNEDYSNIDNLWIKKGDTIIKNPLRPLVEDLDEYPMPDRDLYYSKYPRLRNKKTKFIMTIRGCPYDCSFCFNKKLKEMYKGKGKYIRYHSVDRVIEEIHHIKENYPLETIYFGDDIFILNKKRLMGILDKYIETKVNLPFICLVRANLVDEELVAKLSEAGCYGAWFGLESGNEKLRENVLKKRLTTEQIENTARLLHKYGIKFRAYCMIGLPGETVDNAFDTINLNVKIGTDFPWCSIFTPYSKTDIVDYAVDNGFLSEEYRDHISGSIYKQSILANKEHSELMNLHRFFQTAILMPWTIPLIKKLIKLPPNPLFYLWFGLVYTCVNIRSERHGVMETLKFLSGYISVFLKIK